MTARTMPLFALYCHGCNGDRTVAIDPVDETMTCERCSGEIRCGLCARPATVDHVLDGHPDGFAPTVVVSRFRCDRSGFENALPSSRLRADVWHACEDTEPHGRHLGSVSLTDRDGQTARSVCCPGSDAIDAREVTRVLRKAGIVTGARGFWSRRSDSGVLVEEQGWTVRVVFDYLPDQLAQQLTAVVTVAHALTVAGFRVYRETDVHPGRIGRLRAGRTHQL